MRMLIGLLAVAAAGAQVHVQVQEDRMKWLASEMRIETELTGAVIKGAPYAAEAITETTQMLYDGNRIHRKSTAKIYRDSQGRTRREQTLEALGRWVTVEPLQTILISDPVAKASYSLDPRTRTARKLMIHTGGTGQQIPHGVPGGVVGGVRGGVAGGVGGERIAHQQTFEFRTKGTFEERVRAPETKTESLGRRNIEGVEAEGTRSTMTIPAGEMGNERPIEIVSERWYSPQLQVVVYSKRIDPMFGETEYRLASINRGEPPASLFEVPADYTSTKSMLKVAPRKAQTKE